MNKRQSRIQELLKNHVSLIMELNKGKMRSSREVLQRIDCSHLSPLLSHSLAHTHKAPGDCIAGSGAICQSLLFLGSADIQGLKPGVKSGDSRMSTQASEEFMHKVENAKSAYDDLIEKIAKATESKERKLPPGARNSATKAYDCAEKLYNYIMKDLSSSWTSPKSEDKVLSMPYLVVLAYAARIMADACMVTSHEIKDETSRMLKTQQRSRIISDFLGVARSMVMALILGCGLLEIAKDYHLQLTVYMMLSVGMKASDPMMSEPEAIAAAKKQGWSDKLSGVRGAREKRDDDDDDEESQGHTSISYSHTRPGLCFPEAPAASSPSSSKAPGRPFGLLNSADPTTTAFST